MSDVVISVENLGKRYTLGAGGRSSERYTALRDVIANKAKGFFGKARLSTADSQLSTSSTDFWALKDVSFDIKQGEVVGIIGRNGAGKSTLLKVLSRITDPTEGRIKIKGRIASLLEVGTGFHPELSGRENIYLNGAILGMTRAEIKAKFDEIVAFAEVEKFLDTPVKRYSSGMYVRLAFAVAAHLEPEILIVDEVLAVGDAEFQKKCLGKMQDVAGHGRTVIFVSHNMDAILRLCTRSIILNRGRSEFDGPSIEGAKRYLSNFSQVGQPGIWMDVTTCSRRVKVNGIFFHSATYLSQRIGIDRWPHSDKQLIVQLRISSNVNVQVNSLAVVILSPSFQKLVNADSIILAESLQLNVGINEIHLTIKALHLKPGRYPVGLWLANSTNQIFDYIETAFEIEVTNEQHRISSEIMDDGVVTCDFEYTKV